MQKFNFGPVSIKIDAITRRNMERLTVEAPDKNAALKVAASKIWSRCGYYNADRCFEVLSNSYTAYLDY